jgi:hypothetical protein
MTRLLAPLIVFVATIMYAAEPAAPAVKELKLPARAADSFLDFVGVNIHLGYSDTNYAKYDAIVKPRLLEAGIRNVRDGLRPDRKDVIKKLNDLAASGIRCNIIARPEDAVALIKELKGAILTVEGRNEPDNNIKKDWEAATFAEMKALYAAVKGDAETSSVPVVVSGMANTRDANGKLAALGNVAAFLDFGNMHCYPGGQNPTSGGWGISLDHAIAEERKVCGEHPIICTETGYHNRVDQKGHPGVPNDIEAKYAPRLLLHYWNIGFARVFLYEFLDLKPDPKFTDQEKHFGMLFNDGSPKPVFLALKNLLARLKDAGETVQPGTLDFKVSGDTKNVEFAAFQKRDGTQILTVWQEVSSYDTNKKTPLAVPARALEISFPQAPRSIRVFHPNTSEEAVQNVENADRISLQVPDEVLLLEIAR